MWSWYLGEEEGKEKVLSPRCRVLLRIDDAAPHPRLLARSTFVGSYSPVQLGKVESELRKEGRGCCAVVVLCDYLGYARLVLFLRFSYE